jgi:uncharacterized tellurite resistance protein B-like protein
MISSMSLLRFFKSGVTEGMSPGATDTVRRITEALDRLEPERAKFIAAFAYLLGRAARADLNISPEETKTMERIVMERAGLPEEQAIIVIQIAKTQNILFGGTENFLVSREFKEISTPDERLALLECLYAVAAADESISTIEDNEISQIADELRIEHREFISVRSRYRNYLAVFKDTPNIS